MYTEHSAGAALAAAELVLLHKSYARKTGGGAAATAAIANTHTHTPKLAYRPRARFGRRASRLPHEHALRASQ